MPRQRYLPIRQPHKPTIPFIDAEEAWFWFMRAQLAREEGLRFKGDGAETMRPCDADDIYRAVIGLARRHVIGGHHLRVLASYGVLGWPPDPRLAEQQYEYRLWDEAMDRLTSILKTKEIIV